MLSPLEARTLSGSQLCTLATYCGALWAHIPAVKESYPRESPHSLLSSWHTGWARGPDHLQE